MLGRASKARILSSTLRFDKISREFLFIDSMAETFINLFLTLSMQAQRGLL